MILTLSEFSRRDIIETYAVDPERVLLMDVNYTNNSKTLEPKGEAAAMKWSVKWMIWLQDALLSWAALA